MLQMPAPSSASPSPLLSQPADHVIETDALVIGAGPVGLFQVFQLGLLEMTVHVVDSLPHAGGQCIELYPDKPIYDIPGILRCTGRELTERLLEQIAPFGATLHLGQEVTHLVCREADERFEVRTSAGRQFIAKVVFIAGGVGSFQPRELKVEGVEAYLGTQLFYRLPSDAQTATRHVAVLGAGDAALEAACSLAESERAPAQVTLVHRRDTFQAAPALVARLQALRDAGRVRFLAAQVMGAEEADSRLCALSLLDSEGQTRSLPVDVVLAFLGVSPKIGPIADWGLAFERKQVLVDTERFETKMPGLFAVGDINTYPGKKKLILCGFHEATLAAYGALPRVFPGKRVQMQYTTTSPRLHALLGVASLESAVNKH